ncbi:MAG: DUF1365 domain-containing protein [Aquabacterium sp.]
MTRPATAADDHRRALGHAASGKPGRPLLLVGSVRHARQVPTVHAFIYRSWCLLLPMRALREQPCNALHRNRFGRLAFHDSDHGDGGGDALAWIESLLRQHGVVDADGEIWLQTYPRLYGMVFKPVSFWYCLRQDGRPAAIVAEVNNTFGSRHCYVLRAGDRDEAMRWGMPLRADKALQVSPFFQVRGSYGFRFLFAGGDIATPGRAVARIDYDDGAGGGLTTSFSGHLLPLQADAMAAARRHAPLLMPLVVLRIHWQALRLLIKRVPFFGRDPKPAATPTSNNPVSGTQAP